MAVNEEFSNQIYSVLSDISHPIEGTFYLFLIAVIFRWQWPKAWNKFLKTISAPADRKASQEE